MSVKKRFYILFMYGNLGSTETFGEFIYSVFQSLTDDNVKYVHDAHSAICYFSSRETLQDVSDFFNYILDQNIASFFLIEEPRQMGVRLPQDLFDHLFNLDFTQPGYDPTMNYPMPESELDENFRAWNEQLNREMFGDQPPRPPFLGGEDDEMGGDEIARIRSNYKQPLTVDNILDKILTSGVNSLTDEEKKYLERIERQ